MIFDKLYYKILENKKIKESGKQLSIIPPFPRLAKVFPGIEKGKYWIITSNSGIGKTKFSKFFCITSVYNFIKINPTYKVKVMYFALEETKEDFWLSFISTMLYEKFNIDINPSALKSLGSYTITDDVLDKIKECQQVVDELSTIVDVIDYIHNPTGIYKYIKGYFDNPEIGEYTYDEVNMDGKKMQLISGYKHKEDIHYIGIYDHTLLLSPETINGEKLDLWGTIGHFSKEYALKTFCKRYNMTSIVVVQQVAAQEKQEYYKGESIETKLEPSLDGFAGNKTIQQEADLVLGLFAPVRYGITQYRGYDILKLKDKFRVLKVLKDRNYGLANSYIPMFFNGSTNYFSELEPSEEFKKCPNLYNNYV